MSSARGPDPSEVEIKLGLSPDMLAQAAEHPLLHEEGGARRPPRREVTTYFDTPDRTLDRAGFSLRIRRRGRESIQTLKARNEGSDPFGRGEWEWHVAGDHPELGGLADTPAGELLRDAPPLEPVFSTEITRDLRVLRRDGAIIEAALDRGTVRAGAAEEPISELELELREGPTLRLYQLAEALHAEVAMTLGAESKADRGWRLRLGHPRPPQKQRDVVLPEDVTLGDAFRRIVHAVIANLIANQPSAAAGDAEGVHQMRVAVRRLRAAMTLFKPLLEPGAEARFTAELRRLGGVLGAPRDWDVFLAETLPAAAESGVDEAWLALLRGPAEAARAATHALLEAELRRPALTALVLGLVAWSQHPVALAAPGQDLQCPLADWAERLATRLERKALRRGRGIRGLSTEETHALRKSIKKLRYGVEFLAPLQRRKRAKTYLRGCKALLQELGAMNDAVVAIVLTEQLGGERRMELAPAAAALANWASKRRTAARCALPEAWDEFKALRLPA